MISMLFSLLIVSFSEWAFADTAKSQGKSLAKFEFIGLREDSEYCCGSKEHIQKYPEHYKHCRSKSGEIEIRSCLEGTHKAGDRIYLLGKNSTQNVCSAKTLPSVDAKVACEDGQYCGEKYTFTPLGDLSNCSPEANFIIAAKGPRVRSTSYFDLVPSKETKESVLQSLKNYSPSNWTELFRNFKIYEIPNGSYRGKIFIEERPAGYNPAHLITGAVTAAIPKSKEFITLAGPCAGPVQGVNIDEKNFLLVFQPCCECDSGDDTIVYEIQGDAVVHYSDIHHLPF